MHEPITEEQWRIRHLESALTAAKQQAEEAEGKLSAHAKVVKVLTTQVIDARDGIATAEEALQEIAKRGCDSPNWMQAKAPHPALPNKFDCGDCDPCIAYVARAALPEEAKHGN